MRFIYFSLLFFTAFDFTTLAADSGTLKALKAIEELAGEDVANGYTDLKKYDSKKFDMAKVVKSLKEHYEDDSYGDCKFVVKVGRDAGIQAMRDLDQMNTSETARLLQKLHEESKLRTIVAVHWDGKSGDGVSCDIHRFEIYANDGNLLAIEYSLTD